MVRAEYDPLLDDFVGTLCVGDIAMPELTQARVFQDVVLFWKERVTSATFIFMV